MPIKQGRSNTGPSLPILIVIAVLAYPINGLDSRKLDESTTTPAAGDQSIKCTPSCTPVPPPPPPPSPCPPPPSLPDLPPPPPKKKPPSGYCPPPPPSPSSYIYITGPPGNLYPIDQNFAGAEPGMSKFPVLIVVGLLGFLVM